MCPDSTLFMIPSDHYDRHMGCLVGLAVGDALGTTLEFQSPGTFEPLTDLVGGGPFGLIAGEWTDDTSMAMCLAESLLACGGFDARDQIDRYRQWYRAGYWSCRDHCFDIGNTVRAAIHHFEQTGEAFAGSDDPHAAGNGSIMRLAPVPLYFFDTPSLAIQMSAESSRTTHGAQTCLDACRYLAGLLVGAVQGKDRETLLSPGYAPCPNAWESQPLCPEVAAIAEGSFLRRQPPEIRGTGYVIQSLEAALWAFAQARDFRHGALLAVNLGEDADTTGAIYGQIAGAFFGYSGLPGEWLEKLAWKKQIFRLAKHLFEAVQFRGNPD